MTFLLKSFTLFSSLFIFSQSIAQSNTEDDHDFSKVNLFLDIGAHAIAQASFNFEGKILSGKKITLYGRAGFGLAQAWGDSKLTGGITGLTMLTGKKNNHIEIGGGAFLGFYSNSEFRPLPHFDLGYRYQKSNGGFIFRAKVGILGLGIGLGYAFK